MTLQSGTYQKCGIPEKLKPCDMIKSPEEVATFDPDTKVKVQ